MRKRSIIQMVLIGVLVGIGTALIAYFIPWLPDRGAKEATGIDRVFWFTTFICLAIFALVGAVSIYAGLKFRARPDDEEDGKPIHGHTGLEITWTAVPAVLVTAISIYSGLVLVDVEDIPEKHRTVEVSSVQFTWSFTYPDLELTSGELVLPIGEPVELKLTSRDVIHSFWVPEWRMKQDAVPGVETRTVVTPTQPGTFEVVCTELCGLGHATMRARARVVSRKAFDSWAREQKGGDTGGGGTAANGKQIFASQGCGSCHTLSDAGSSGQTGPNLDNSLEGDDEDFVRESILDPNAEIAEGFQPGVMPSYEGRLSDGELDTLVGYLLKATKKGG